MRRDGDRPRLAASRRRPGPLVFSYRGALPMRIALDAMGGGHAPGPIVAGAVQAGADGPELTVVLVGDQARIEAELANCPDAPRDRLPIVHAREVIAMDEKPAVA